MHASSLKIAHCCLYAVTRTALTHDCVGLFQTGISRVRARSLCGLEYESWSLGYSSVKPRDPTFISFDALPACDRQTDRQTDRHAANRCSSWARQKRGTWVQHGHVLGVMSADNKRVWRVGVIRLFGYRNCPRWWEWEWCRPIRRAVTLVRQTLSSESTTHSTTVYILVP